jgi:DNA-binding XRE family transcriptional regulator
MQYNIRQEERHMENLSAVIGANLAEIRRMRGLSLDKVAEMSGVSKAMVGQIERGESNPTVAHPLESRPRPAYPFSELITEKRTQVEVVHSADIPPVVDEAAGVKIFPLFPFECDRHFEIFLATLDSSASHASDPHATRSEEYIILIEGAIEIIIGGDAYRLEAATPSAATPTGPFLPQPHRPTARFLNIIYYGQSGDQAPPRTPAPPEPQT